MDSIEISRMLIEVSDENPGINLFGIANGLCFRFVKDHNELSYQVNRTKKRQIPTNSWFLNQLNTISHCLNVSEKSYSHLRTMLASLVELDENVENAGTVSDLCLYLLDVERKLECLIQTVKNLDGVYRVLSSESGFLPAATIRTQTDRIYFGVVDFYSQCKELGELASS